MNTRSSIIAPDDTPYEDDDGNFPAASKAPVNTAIAKRKPLVIEDDDADEDYTHSREKYYDLIEKNMNAIETLSALAEDAESPRAFEVLSNMIKQTAEITDRLMELQEKRRAVIEYDESEPTGNSTNNNNNNNNNNNSGGNTNNNFFFGSSTDLQRILQKKISDLKIIEGERVEQEKKDE